MFKFKPIWFVIGSLFMLAILMIKENNSRPPVWNENYIELYFPFSIAWVNSSAMKVEFENSSFTYEATSNKDLSDYCAWLSLREIALQELYPGDDMISWDHINPMNDTFSVFKYLGVCQTENKNIFIHHATVTSSGPLGWEVK